MENLEQDELILAEILAGYEVSSKGVGLGDYGVSLQWPNVLPMGKACAIGLGLLWEPHWQEEWTEAFDCYNYRSALPLDAFAQKHKVSRVYATGVMDGYEQWNPRPGEAFSHPDYDRGYQVGSAARIALHPDIKPGSGRSIRWEDGPEQTT